MAKVTGLSRRLNEESDVEKELVELLVQRLQTRV